MSEISLTVDNNILSRQLSLDNISSNNINSITISNINRGRLYKSMITDNDEYILIIPKDSENISMKIFISVSTLLVLILFNIFVYLSIFKTSGTWINMCIISFVLICIFGMPLVDSKSIFNQRVLRINRNKISFVSRNMFYVTDEIELKGLGITWQRIVINTTDFMGFRINERKVVHRDDHGHVINESTYATLKVMHRDGLFPIKEFPSLEETSAIRTEIHNYALEYHIGLNIIDV